MTPWEAIAVFVAGVCAGGVNTVVGSGTLITFPVLLATGLSPVTATVSNALGLVPGAVSGAFGYRKELRGQRRRILKLGVGALLGGFTGATLLLALPASAFEKIVPVVVGLALVLVAFQPLITRRLRRRRASATVGAPGPDDRAPGRGDGGPLLFVGLALASVYGGYFAAAQGIIYMSLMGVLLDETLQRLTAVKNVLVAVVNTVAATFFLFVADFDWTAVALIAVGSALGGQLGAVVGRRFSPVVLRALIVTIGTVALVQLLLR
ncbi:sulfite exporter TauE/SafE family protein [Streptomyces sp. Qhu-G9]|uniref:sulfite exporter TauE/SafE family protein n=1 Tax=Streptomyces sp. Qhu-G9 TaxID=3452799 RepID=UPI0022AC803A|nr:sulfite exporter TauE/SafE family protein [Streptomyces aurantiacus]WAU83444.1 sulfite exporter TauE/SafE family protein [Streptomyces aurantiacus]